MHGASWRRLPRLVGAGLFLFALALAPPARAEPSVDPRYPYTVELGASAAFSASVRATVPALGAGRLAFFAPIGQSVQLGGGVWFDSYPVWRLLAGLRFLNESAPWRTALDVQLATDVAPTFAVGVRAAVGLQYELGGGVRLGASAGAALLAVEFQAVPDAGVTLSYSW